MKSFSTMEGTKKVFGAIAVLAVSTILCTGCSGKKYPDGLYAELNTNRGKIVLRLEYEKAPMTVANFVGLSEGTIANAAFPEGTPYFDGTAFHRVVPGHVIQAGIPKDGQESSPGYTFPNEIHPELGHGKAGMLGMANGGPHTNSSQFYITLGDRSYLDGDYTVFGQVAEGMEVVNAVVQGDIIESVVIVRAGKRARRFTADTETLHKMVTAAEERVKKEEVAKKKKEAEIIWENWPQALATESGLKYVVVREGKGTKPETGAVLQVVYTGKTLFGEKSFSSNSEGNPVPHAEAVPFEFVLGQSRAIPGIAEALMDMTKGEKRILILLSPLAYGTSGHYAREVKGQKRFVISPNTSLVLELTVLD